MKNSPYIDSTELEFLKTHGETKSLVYISKSIGRSWNFVKKCLGNLGIKNTYDNSRKWVPSEEEIQVLRSGRPSHEIAITLNKSVPTVLKQMRILSIIDPKVKRLFRDYSIPRVVVPKIVPVSVPRENGDDRIKEALRRIGAI